MKEEHYYAIIHLNKVNILIRCTCDLKTLDRSGGVIIQNVYMVKNGHP